MKKCINSIEVQYIAGFLCAEFRTVLRDRPKQCLAAPCIQGPCCCLGHLNISWVLHVHLNIITWGEFIINNQTLQQLSWPRIHFSRICIVNWPCQPRQMTNLLQTFLGVHVCGWISGRLFSFWYRFVVCLSLLCTIKGKSHTCMLSAFKRFFFV